MSNFKAVIFDMDGVLIDARDWHYEALNESLQIFGLSISREDHESRFNGLSTKTKLNMLSAEGKLPKDLHEIIEAVKQDRTLRIAALNCFPNVAHHILISRLKSLGIKIGLFTNSIRQTSEYMLEYSGILNFLEIVITNEDVENGKPDPEGYIKAMEILGVEPKETIVVEDGEYGIIAAMAAGATVARVNSPTDVNLELLIPYFPKLKV